MARDTYAEERCECGEPATLAVLDRRGFVCGAACATHRGKTISTVCVADRFVIEVIPSDS